jgi:hypothetical protein
LKLLQRGHFLNTRLLSRQWDSSPGTPPAHIAR